MAKKKVKKETKPVVVRSDEQVEYVRLKKQVELLEQRFDCLVKAIDKSKSVRGI